MPSPRGPKPPKPPSPKGPPTAGAKRPPLSACTSANARENTTKSAWAQASPTKEATSELSPPRPKLHLCDVETDEAVLLTRRLSGQLIDAASRGATQTVAELCALPQVDSFIDEPSGDAQATALMLAVKARCLDAVQALLRAGADTNLCDAQGRTALMLAASNCDVDLFAPLLDRGADAALKANNGWTCLLFACGSSDSVYGHCEAVKSLIELSEERGKMRDDLELQAALGLARTRERLGVVQLLEARLEDELGSFTPRGA